MRLRWRVCSRNRLSNGTHPKDSKPNSSTHPETRRALSGGPPLRPRGIDIDDEFLKAFGDAAWFELRTERRSWQKTVYIARSCSDYAPEGRTRVVLNGARAL